MRRVVSHANDPVNDATHEAYRLEYPVVLKVLDWFGASALGYSVIFTANATAALKV